MKSKVKNKTKLKNKSIVLLLGVVYTLITVLATTSYISNMSNMSTTAITFGSVISAIWWQLVMILMFGVVYILYSKKEFLGILLEIVMGLAMLIYVIITIVTMGINIFALLIELIYPLSLTIHGLISLKALNKTSKIKKSTI